MIERRVIRIPGVPRFHVSPSIRPLFPHLTSLREMGRANGMGAKPSGKGSVANRARGEWVGMRGEEPSGEAMNGVRRSGSDDRKEDPTKGGYE